MQVTAVLHRPESTPRLANKIPSFSFIKKSQDSVKLAHQSTLQLGETIRPSVMQARLSWQCTVPGMNLLSSSLHNSQGTQVHCSGLVRAVVVTTSVRISNHSVCVADLFGSCSMTCHG